MTIEQLEQDLFSCNKCSLYLGATAPTSFTGNAKSPFVIVGEGPGAVEDEYGAPLVGPSGQLLDKALFSVGITRDRVYTTNVIKCRPKNNRTPTLEECEFCAGLWLDKEIEIIRPKVIVALGSVALKYLYDSTKRITKERGNWFQTKYGVMATATYHPAYLLRLDGKELVRAKWEVFYDLKSAVEKCNELSGGYLLKSDQPADLLKIFESRRQNRKLLIHNS
jgi:DNA polymerase